MALFSKTNEFLKPVKILVGAAASTVDPTGLAATATAIDTYHYFYEKLGKNTSQIDKLVAEMATNLETRFKDKNFHRPTDADADKLLIQMASAATISRADFVNAGIDAEPIMTALKERLRKANDTALRREDLIDAFDRFYGPELEFLCDDPRLKALLDPALHRQAKKQRDEQGDDIKEILTRLGGLEQAVANPDSASLEDLNKLACAFEECDFVSKAEALGFLSQKAEEYRSYRAQVENIDETHAQLANMKAAARDAADNLRFDEVEELLASVDATETAIAAQSKELRAENALLRGRVEQAFEIYSAIADSFGSIDQTKPAQLRLQFFERLYNHGLRYMGAGLALSERMIRDAEIRIDHGSQPEMWAKAQNALGISLNDQGTRASGPAASDFWVLSAQAFERALRIYTEEASPANYAMTQNNLGITLKNQGNLASGQAASSLLAQSAQAYERALRIFTEEASPADYAMTQINLGITLHDQGIRALGQAALNLLAKSAQAYERALRIYTEEASPKRFAITQNNLGNTLQQQGIRASGQEALILLAQSAQAYESALRIRTENVSPADYAMSQNNLGLTLLEQGIRTSGLEALEILAQAAQAFENALRIRTEEASPADFAYTQENLAILHLRRSKLGEDPQGDLAQALTAVNAALRIYDDSMPYFLEKATRLRDDILAAMDAG